MVRSAATRRRIGLVCLAWLLIALANPGHAQVRDAIVKYQSGDRQVTLECFVPTTPGKHPAVLLLHGSGGLEEATGPIFREIAAAMARSGYVALIPHYFEKTNHVMGRPLKTGENEAMIDSIKDAIEFAANQPEVEPKRFAIVGYSMGSNMAMVTAIRDPRVKAVASWSGAYHPKSKPNPKLPPLLILHGSQDKSTPVDYALKYQAALKAQEMPHDLFVYKGMGHNFDIERFEDATVRTVEFFDKYINAPDKPSKDPDKAPDKAR